MTAREELRDLVEGKPPPVDHAAALTAALGQDERGRKVTSANVFGTGPDAIVVLALDDGARLRVPRFGDLTKPQVLSAWLVTTTGVFRTFKGPECGQIAAAVHALAHHHAEADEDAAVGEYCSEFLRLAPVLEVDMADQAARWAAFSALGRMNPARDAGEDRSADAYAAASTVLLDASGTRYVRTGWLQGYVKREVAGLYSPADLARRVQLVGWQRGNSEGRIKATSSTDGRSVGWKFYTVAEGWEDAQVPAGSRSSARGSEEEPRARSHKGTCGNPSANGTVQEQAHAGKTAAREGSGDPNPTGNLGDNPTGKPRRHVDGTAYDEPPAWMPQRDGVPS